MQGASYERQARSLRLVVLVALSLLALAPTDAFGAGANVQDFGDRSSVIYYAGPGEQNDLAIAFADGQYVLTDPGATIEARGGCQVVDSEAHKATCPAHGSVGAEVSTGDEADRISVDLPPPAPPFETLASTTLSGGEGNDRIEGGRALDKLRGEQGDDSLAGGDHSDQLDGGPGDDLLDGGSDYLTSLAGGSGPPDFLDGGPGADVLMGGPGIADRVLYGDRSAPVHASLDGQRNDGELGENDLIADDVEGLDGGAGDDVLTGNRQMNGLFGHQGDDTLDGRHGLHDGIFPGAGSDILYLHDGGIEGKGVPGTGAFPPHWDDIFDCDGVLGETAGARDIALLDVGDWSAGGPSSGCETMLFSTVPIRLGEGAGSVTVHALCPGNYLTDRCEGVAKLRTPASARRGHKSAKRFKLPRRWQELGRHRFTARARRGKTIRVALSRSGRKLAAKKPRLRVYVTFAFAGPER